MNLAIILAVSEYSKAENNLPASNKDGEIINTLISQSNKFDKILLLTKSEKSSLVKEQLSNFIIENRNLEIDELFFYYSGHGEFSNDEFYYLLSDFDNKRKHQTSIQNSEVDDLIRTLSPNLVVKVIDACQSGTTYIKEQDVLTKYFNESKKSFKKCYFLNSSLNNQSSYQDDNLSFFTYSFVQAIKEHPSNEIRYKDIIDYILDDFQDNNFQTPFFVLQAELTEKFCQINDDLRKSLNAFDEKEAIDKGEKPKTLYDLVTQNAKEYVDKDGAINALEFCRNEFSTLKLNDDISKLFDLKIDFIGDNNHLKGVRAIGKWLTENKNDYFAKPYYVQEPDFLGVNDSVLKGYTLLIEAPFKAVKIEIIGKYPNVKSYQTNIAILLSKKEITFYNIIDYKEVDWDNKILNIDNLKWTYSSSKIGLKESISNNIKEIIKFINDKIISDINTQFGLQKENLGNENDDLPF